MHKFSIGPFFSEQMSACITIFLMFLFWSAVVCCILYLLIVILGLSYHRKTEYYHIKLMKWFLVTVELRKGFFVKWLRHRPVMRNVLGSNLKEITIFHSSNCFCFGQMLVFFGYTCPEKLNADFTTFFRSSRLNKSKIDPFFHGNQSFSKADKSIALWFFSIRF